MYAKLTDERLYELAAKDRDNDALTVLMSRYQKRLCTRIRKELIAKNRCEDLLQLTWWRALRNWKTFDPEKGTFCSWIHKTASQLTGKDNRRTKYYYDRMEAIDAEEVAGNLISSEKMPGADLVLHEDIDRLHAALKQLPELDRQIITRTYFDGEDAPTIAEEIGASAGHVRDRRREALIKLRARVSQS